MKIDSETMRSILWDESIDGKIIENIIVDTSRWSIHHDIVFEYKGKFYKAGYSKGATEQQDEQPWEYEKEVECIEVHQVEKVVKVWEAI